MKLTEHIILLSQFHLTKNEKNAGEYTSGENKKIWWQCPVAFDHVWPARFADRIQVFKRRGNETYEDGGTVGCPFCAPNSKPSSTNNLELLRPEIAQEWDCEANHPLTPKEVTIKSSQIVSWICAKGHKYTSTVYDRTRGDRPHSCPDCSSKNSSPEFRIVAELKLIFSEIQHRKRIEHLEADIFIPELNLAIEYDGGYYHTSTSKDRQKNEFFKGKGIQLIRIRQGNLKKISALDVVETSSSIKKSTVNRLLHSIQKIFPFAKEKKAIEEYIELDELQNKALSDKTNLRRGGLFRSLAL
jgi:very-short-patch-repair endonuclease